MAADYTDVAHAWMHQTTDRLSSYGNRMYFVGSTVYSYGSHYAIAKHWHVKGQDVILFNSTGNSKTTSKHKYIVRAAIPRDAKVIYVREVEKVNVGIVVSEINYLVTEMLDLAEKQSRARVTDYTGQIKAHAYTIKQYFEFAKKANPTVTKKAILTHPELLRSSYVDKFIKATEEVINSDEFIKTVFELKEVAVKLDARHATLKEAKAEKARQKAIKEWKEGKGTRSSISHLNVTPQLLRVAHATGIHPLSAEVDVVQTSLGVEIELEEARLLYRVVKAVKTKGEDVEFEYGTKKIAGYSVNSISKHGTLRAGCHLITFEEIEQVSKQLNW